MINVTVWNEYRHEIAEEHVRKIYPDGMHNAIADFLKTEDDITVRTVTLDQENCGITDELLEWTDVMLWWGHWAHDEVPDSIAQKVHNAVLDGMGIIFLHSGHYSKPFKFLMGTRCGLGGWRLPGEKARMWVTDMSHPIVQGIGRYLDVEKEEMYSEPFEIPNPEQVLFITAYENSEVLRSGCCWHRQNGKIFYFQPGHEEYPVFYQKEIQTVIKNAVRWAKPNYRSKKSGSPMQPIIE